LSVSVLWCPFRSISSSAESNTDKSSWGITLGGHEDTREGRSICERRRRRRGESSKDTLRPSLKTSGTSAGESQHRTSRCTGKSGACACDACLRCGAHLEERAAQGGELGLASAEELVLKLPEHVLQPVVYRNRAPRKRTTPRPRLALARVCKKRRRPDRTFDACK